MSTPTPLLVHRVIARLNVGGPAMHVVHLTRHMDDGRPFRTRLLAGEVGPDEGDMAYYARERGVEVTKVPTLRRPVRLRDDLRSLWTLWRRFRREKPDVVHTHTAKAGTVGRLAAALAGVPVRIHTFHGHVLGGGYFSQRATKTFRRIERFMARLTTRIVALTEAQKRELSQELEIAAADKFTVIPLGLELERFVPDDRRALRDEVRAELGIAPETAVVGIVGRLVRIKNHELLLDAVPLLRERLGRRAGEAGGAAPRDLVVLVVGSGELEPELEAHARRLGIDDAVRFLGWRRDVERLYPAMDVLALTSLDEGTPVAVIEAMAAGTDVVARSVGGVREVLEDGRWGRLVWRPDPAMLAEHLDEALADPPEPGKRDAMIRAALERFGVERLVDDVRELYLRELERAGVGVAASGSGEPGAR